MKIFGKEFAGQELVIGAFANGLLLFKLPIVQSAPVIAASSILWTLGGTFFKPLRRFGVPLIALPFMWLSWSNVAAAVLGIVWLHQGDGFPDRRPTTADPGSWLGKLVEKAIPAPEIGGPFTKYLAGAIYMLTVALHFL